MIVLPPRSARAGFTFNEKLLAMVCLSIAVSSTFLLFAMSGSEMRQAQQRQMWRHQVEDVLEVLAGELGQSAEIVEPFSGDGARLLYQPLQLNSEGLLPAAQREAVLVSGGNLLHAVEAAGGILANQPLGRRDNPLLRGVQTLICRRLDSRLLELRLTVAPPPPATGTADFARVVRLRNR